MTLNGHSKNKKMSPKICETRCRKPVDLVVFIKTKYFICYANLKAGASVTLVLAAESYYNFENNKYIYGYNDHLKNVRLSYFKNAEGSAEVDILT